jgi:NAD(P)-dependent dehydrogenase (short-subunit alcohol dehydrogenase family)
MANSIRCRRRRPIWSTVERPSSHAGQHAGYDRSESYDGDDPDRLQVGVMARMLRAKYAILGDFGGFMSTSKVVLVTGASSGLGRAMAEHLSAVGYIVFGTSRKRAGSTGAVRMLALDVTDDVSVQQTIGQVIAETGRIDVLVNNAGIGLCGAVEDTSVDEARWQFETNFFGTVRVTRAVLPHMRQNGKGRVITVSSLAGMAALPFQPYYSAAKFALEGWNEALRLELAGSVIDCTTINPGDFKTGFTAARVFAREALTGRHAEQLKTTAAIYERDENRGADPLLVARLAEKLIARRRVGVRYTVGSPIQRFGMVLKRVLPATVFERIMKGTYGIR